MPSSRGWPRRTAAYRTDDGSWYFRIASFPDYGKLSKKDFTGITDGARVDVDEYDKDSARDFALWKSPKPGEYHWQTDLGPGRPGWHIECSAMATEYLGDDFDLHAGGEDLMFPHHENEIAQSESASHNTFARHWFHVRFLLVEGRKMSKSEGNFYTLRDLLLKGYKASAIRMLLISVPYRQQLNFTFEGLAAETGAIDRLRTFHQRVRTAPTVPALNPDLAAETARSGHAFCEALAQRPQHRRGPGRHLRPGPRRQRRHRCRHPRRRERPANPRRAQPLRSGIRRPRRPRCRVDSLRPRLGRTRRPP